MVGSGRSQADGRIFFARLCARRPAPAGAPALVLRDILNPHDERIPRLTQLPHGRLVPLTELYTPEELKTSATYNEALPRGGYQNGLNVRLDGPHESHIVWTLADSTDPAGWQSDRIELIEYLLPHIRQFVLVRQTLTAAQGLGASLTQLLDNGRVGVIQLDRLGRIAAANDAARRVLRSGDALFDRDATLHARLPQDDDHLQNLLQRAMPKLGGGPPAAGSMTLRRPPALVRLGLHVTPVGDPQSDSAAAGWPPWCWSSIRPGAPASIPTASRPPSPCHPPRAARRRCSPRAARCATSPPSPATAKATSAGSSSRPTTSKGCPGRPP